MVKYEDINIGDIIEINHPYYGGRWEVINKYEKYFSDYLDLRNDLGRVEDFSISFINSYNVKILNKQEYSIKYTSPDSCHYHDFVTEKWFSAKEFTYCKRCGKMKEESKSYSNREFF